MNGVAMTTFTIDPESDITAFASFEEANATDHAGQIFTSPEEFQTITASWPYARLVEIYNSLPGIVTIKKFATRRIAAVRIWEADGSRTRYAASLVELWARSWGYPLNLPAQRTRSDAIESLRKFRIP